MKFFFFKQARGITHHVDFTPFEVKSGSLFFVAPRQVHFLTRKSKASKYQIYVITFSEDFLAQLIAEAGYDDIISEVFGTNNFLSIPRADKTMEKLWKLMHDEVKEKEIDYEKLVLNLFRNLLVYFKRKLLQHKKLMVSNERLQLFRHFQKLVEKHCLEQWTVQKYASKMNITTRQLNRICSVQKDCSPQQVIHGQLNIEAKRRLYHSGMQVKEIATTLAFSNQANFSRFFTTMNKESPGAFKNRMAQKDK